MKRLKKLLDRDHTGLAASLNKVLRVVNGYFWIPLGEWGSYEYQERTEATLRGEVKNAFDEIAKVCDIGLRDSGLRANAAFRPEADLVHNLTVERDALRKEVAELRASYDFDWKNPRAAHPE